MKITGLITLLLSLVDATDTNGIAFLRKAVEPTSREKLDLIECLKARDQNSCDSTKDGDGSNCVWCSITTVGGCVNHDIAEQLKAKVPNIECDGTSNNDDDDNDDGTRSDDKVTPTTDDDVAPNDDATPNDYWKCLMKYDSLDQCTEGGCAWCKTNAGYGLCMDTDIAEKKSDSDWYDCTMPISNAAEDVSDPSDPSCIVATVSGDESTCKQTADASGSKCEWCTFNGFDFCVNDEQAQIAEQIGASCGEDELEDKDPNDLSCLATTINGGDETACKNTMDAEDKQCEFCSFDGFNFCFNEDQAQIIDQFGGQCGDGVVSTM